MQSVKDEVNVYGVVMSMKIAVEEMNELGILSDRRHYSSAQFPFLSASRQIHRNEISS